MEAGFLQEEQHSRKDFFISYTPADRQWAEWIAWQLEQNQYTVTIDVWDFRPGSNSILELNKAITESVHTIALLSPHYVDALRTLPDWTVAFKRDASGEQKSLILVKVRACEVEGLFSAIELINLVGKDAATALDQLVQGVKGIRAKPIIAPTFPGSKPQIIGMQLKNNPLFAGRERALASLHKWLHAGAIVALTQTLTASNYGVGKTEVAKEYLYRYQSDYKIVLWIQDNPLNPSLVPFFQSVRKSAHELDLPVQDLSDDFEILLVLKSWLDTHTNWLLVLDGVKDIQMLQHLLPTQPKGHILVTTRERAIASMAQLFELDDRTDEERALSEKLAQLVDVALHSANGEQYHVGLNTTIGSAQGNTIVLDDPSVSAYHAVILSKNQTYQITDLKSSYGTFVNGQRLTPEVAYALAQGDTIYIGTKLFAYGSDKTTLIFPHLVSARDPEQRVGQTPSLPKIVDAQAIVQQARQEDAPATWRIYRSEKYSFEDLRHLIVHLDVAFIRALILLFFLLITDIPLLFALQVEDASITTFIVLPTLFLDVLAIAVFVVTMVRAIKRVPGIVMDVPYPMALLVLTPDGFVEYKDKNHATDIVSFADLIRIQIHIDNDSVLLQLSYANGEEGQWSQRAAFGPQQRIAQEIVEAFIHYQKHHQKIM